MSEISTILFQFSKRANTLNVNQEEMPDFNSKISLIAERYDIKPENIKDLFKFLIDFAIHETDFTENQQGITLQEGEVIVRQESIDALNKQITEMQAEEEKRFADSLLVSEAMENVLLVPCTPEQKEVLEGIAQNRFEAEYDNELKGPADIVKDITFRSCYLYNEYRRYYTGL